MTLSQTSQSRVGCAYVGIGANTTAGSANAPEALTDHQRIGDCLTDSALTLAEFHGNGTCYLLSNFSLPSSNYSDYCLNQEIVPQPDRGHQPAQQVTQAAEGLWFICTQGIFKCLVPTGRPELCVSAYIIPQVYLYGGNPTSLVEPRR